jgi:glutathione S-transferase
MKLFYRSGTCAQAPHILLRELDLPFQLVKVDTKAGVTESGADFLAVNPKGYVPVLELDDGQRLTEASVILQYLGDRKPEAKLVPLAGTMERYRLQEWLNYVSAEMHKSLGSLFNKQMPDAWRAAVREMVGKKLDFLSRQLEGKEGLMGAFSAADAYLFVVLGWAKHHEIDLARWPVVQAYRTRIAQRPAVQAALKAEGLA